MNEQILVKANGRNTVRVALLFSEAHIYIVKIVVLSSLPQQIFNIFPELNIKYSLFQILIIDKRTNQLAPYYFSLRTCLRFGKNRAVVQPGCREDFVDKRWFPGGSTWPVGGWLRFCLSSSSCCFNALLDRAMLRPMGLVKNVSLQ